MAILLAGCQKLELQIEGNQESHPTFLTLTQGSVKEAVTDAANFELLLTSVSDDLPSFVSYYDYFNEVEQQLAILSENESEPFRNIEEIKTQYNVTVEYDDGAAEVLPLVRSLVLRKLINQQGVLQIDDIVYQYLDNVVLKAPVNKVTDFTDLSQVPGVKSEEYHNLPLTSSVDLKRNLEGLCNVEYRVNRRDHRLKPRWYSLFTKIGSEKVGETWVEAKHQKKRFGIWWANDEDRITMSGNWNLFQGANLPPEPTPVNETCTNCNKLEEIISLMPTTDAEKDRTDWILTGSSTNNSSIDGGVTRSCVISN